MKRTPHEHVKPTFSDMPAEALWELGKTYALGARKHGVESWREPRSWLEVYDGMMRHMLQWRMGEDKSLDDQHYHMGAIAHRALWLLACHLNPEKYEASDDRRVDQDEDICRAATNLLRPANRTQNRNKNTHKKGKEQNHGKA